MPPTYQQNKKSIYNWVSKNKELHYKIVVKSNRRRRAWNKIKTEFLNILL